MIRRVGWLAVILVALAGIASADVAVGYLFDVTTSYYDPGYVVGDGTFSNLGGTTGFLVVQDAGHSSFGGTITMSGSSPGTGAFIDPFSGYFGPDSGGLHTFIATSNGGAQGGFGPQGILLTISGVVSLGSLSEQVDLTVSDSQIHSGVPRVSPCDGLTTDAFVLQGGSPSGCENPLSFESSQAPGTFQFAEMGPGYPTVYTPEPECPALLITAAAIILARWKGVRS